MKNNEGVLLTKAVKSVVKATTMNTEISPI